MQPPNSTAGVAFQTEISSVPRFGVAEGRNGSLTVLMWLDFIL